MRNEKLVGTFLLISNCYLLLLYGLDAAAEYGAIKFAAMGVTTGVAAPTNSVRVELE